MNYNLVSAQTPRDTVRKCKYMFKLHTLLFQTKGRC